MLDVSTNYQNSIKSSVRSFKGKVEVYFDGPSSDPVVFDEEDYVVSIELLEEFYTEGNNPLGLISSNEIVIYLLNEDKLFTPTNTDSPYHGKLLPNLQVNPYIALLVGSSYEYVPLGEFYTGDWVTTGNSLQTSLRCTDKLSRHFDDVLPQIPVQENTTTKDMFEKLFAIIGLDPDDYEIDPSLIAPIRYGWFEGEKIRQAVQNLASNSCCSVYVNRYGKIIVRNNYKVQDSVALLTNEDQVISSEVPQRYSRVYSAINVNYGRPYIGESTTLLSLINVNIDQDGIELVRAKFTSGPVVVIDQITIESNAELEVGNFSYGAWDCDLFIPNTSGATMVSITIVGRKMERLQEISKLTNDELQAIIGYKPMTLSPYLVQNKNDATLFGGLLLGLVSDPLGYITAETIGNPALELGDTITLQNPSHGMDYIDMIITRMHIIYNGSLSCKLEGISKESRVVYTWVSVSPGMYNLVPREVS